MKIKRLAYAALAAGMLLPMASSCKSDPNPFDLTFTSESNKAKISLQFEVSATRAAEDASNDDEKRISKVNVYVFDATNKLEAFKTDLNVSSDLPVELEVTAGRKTVYAISAKAVITDAAVGMSMDAFEAKVFSSKVADLKFTNQTTKETEFVMVGKSDPQNVLKSVSEATMPASNVFKIELERLLAKTQVKVSDKVDVSALGFSIEGNMTFGVSQTANKMRLQPNGERVCEFSDYSISNMSEFTNVITTGGFNNGSNCMYVPENIVNNPVAGNTSYVCLIVPLKPTHIYTYSGILSRTPNEATQLSSFYAVGIVDAENGFQDYAVDADNNGQIITFTSQNDADAYASALNGGSESAMTVSESEASLMAPAGGTRAASSRQFQSILFNGGTAYYRINIKDTDGTYKVERNKFYKITVNSIKNLGSHSLNILRPTNNEASLEMSSSVWINAVFTVADWDPEEQDVDL